jgi:hypothetical protein
MATSLSSGFVPYSRLWKLRALCAHILLFSYSLFEVLVIQILYLNARNENNMNSKNLQGKQETVVILT